VKKPGQLVPVDETIQRNIKTIRNYFGQIIDYLNLINLKEKERTENHSE
jgi:hypothetical protein